jgi:dTDP-4-amino-4,6-dideoxygalactose transaminase
LKTLESNTNRRRQIWGRFNEAASKSGLQLVGTSDESFVAHLGIIDCLGQRPIVKKHLNESGISTDIHYPIPDHKQNAWLDKDVSLPETERQSRDFLTIPLFPNLTEIEISQICRALEEVGDVI